MRKTAPAVLAATLLAACMSNEGSKSGSLATGGTLIFDAPGDATDIFPPFVTDQNGAVVIDLLFDHLADISHDLQTKGDKGFSPRLARSWTWAADSLSITFNLDPRARWHDGKPVTAADVRYSVRVFTDSAAASPVAPLLANVDSASVKDSSTVTLWFKKHTPEQFYDVAYQLYILPEHVYGAVPLDKLRASELAKKPIGSGPFRFVEWQPDVRLVVVADTANYHGRPKLDRVIVTPVSDPAVMRTQLLTGQADFMQNYAPDLLAQLDSSKVAKPVAMPTLQYVYMGMNLYAKKSNKQAHPIFGDLRVRRAISMAIDRARLLQNVFGDKGRISHGPFPMTLAAADSTIKLPPFDTTWANALLDSAGWKRGTNGMRSKFGTPMRFSLMYPGTSVPRKAYAVLIQEQLRRAGIQVDIDGVDIKVFLAKIQAGKVAGDFDAIINSFQTDPTPSDTKQAWGTVGIGSQGVNAVEYSNPKVDALLDSMTLAFDPTEAKSYASRAFQQIVDDAPAVWLYDVYSIHAANRRIDIASVRADGWWRTLDTWSIPPDKRIDRDRIGLKTASR